MMKDLNKKVLQRLLCLSMIVLISAPALLPSCGHAEETNYIDASEEYIDPTVEEYVASEDSDSEGSDDINPLSLSYFSVVIKKLSASSIKVIVNVKATSTPITSRVYLQRYASSRGSYANVRGVSSAKKVSSHKLKHTPTFSISPGGKYRIKVIVSDGTKTSTKYRKL